MSHEVLKEARKLAGEGRPSEALDVLRAGLAPGGDFALLARAARWASKTDWPGLRPIKVAFLGGGTLDHLVQFMGLWLLLSGFKLEAYVAPYGVWRMEILNPKSAFYGFRPEVAWLFNHFRDFPLSPPASADDPAEAEAVWRAALSEMESYWAAISMILPGIQIIQNNLDPIPERAWGHFEALLPGSRTSMRRAFNFHLPAAAAQAGVQLFDLEQVAMTSGLNTWHDHGYWFHSKHPFAPGLAPTAAFQAARFLAGGLGGAKKALVLDLDNTLWGGVIGDDGLAGIKLGNGADGEAFAAFQAYLKNLTDRGIILAVASKNEESAAKAPFLEHPAMVLRLDDIAVFKADWRNKADNIREIAEILNIGLDSLVFVDDNPAERALVLAELPMVAVPEMPADPAAYIPALDSLAFFETTAYSKEDRARGRMYLENARRHEARIHLTNIDDYLKSLEMKADSGPAEAFALPRMAQLVNKSNQFHPTTTRYTEQELRVLAENGRNVVRWFSLTDRFGDYGLIAVLVLKPQGRALVIDTWAMSCRVLERGMEEFIIRELAGAALAAGADELIGLYRPTPKNALVAGLYEKLGFIAREPGVFNLALPSQRAGRELFIAQKENDYA